MFNREKQLKIVYIIKTCTTVAYKYSLFSCKFWVWISLPPISLLEKKITFFNMFRYSLTLSFLCQLTIFLWHGLTCYNVKLSKSRKSWAAESPKNLVGLLLRLKVGGSPIIYLVSSNTLRYRPPFVSPSPSPPRGLFLISPHLFPLRHSAHLYLVPCLFSPDVVFLRIPFPYLPLFPLPSCPASSFSPFLSFTSRLFLPFTMPSSTVFCKQPATTVWWSLSFFF